MKRAMCVSACVVLALAGFASAQTGTADTPTKEDVSHFLEVMHVREQMKTMMDTAMAQSRIIARQTLQKSMPNASPDDIARAERVAEAAWKNVPIDDYIDAIIPVYQRHFTRADMDAIVAFYQSPVGLKLQKEMPAMMVESVQAASAVTQKHLDSVMKAIDEQVNAMRKSEQQK